MTMDVKAAPGSGRAVVVVSGALRTGGDQPGVPRSDDIASALQSRLDALWGETRWTVWLSAGQIVGLSASSRGGIDPQRAADRFRHAVVAVCGHCAQIGSARVEASLAEGLQRARAALWAAELPGGPVGPTVDWSDLGVWRILAMPLMSPGAASQMATELPFAVRALVDDPACNTLLPTLRSYLATGGDVRACAAQLHVHRSTLYHRLNRLAEVLSIDLRDGMARFELMLALCVLDARSAGEPAVQAV